MSKSSKIIFHLRTGSRTQVLGTRIYSSTLWILGLQVQWFSMQNFKHHGASEEMRLANSGQNWGEDWVDCTTSYFIAHSNLKNWEAFSKNTLKNKTVMGKGVRWAVVIKQIPKNDLWGTRTVCILNTCTFSCVFLCSLQNQSFINPQIWLYCFQVT